uniref:Protein tweety homolog n=1 Tax=Caenorhabditis tropicalis TaxID=1561998 RepID=A0A1I7SYG9_9PELO
MFKNIEVALKIKEPAQGLSSNQPFFSPDVLKKNLKSHFALALIACLGAAVSLLLLVTIIIVWICQACRKNETTGKTRRRVRRLSTVLFIISVLCFFMLGICLFANEHVNRGMSISINSVINTKKSYQISMAQIDQFQEAALNTTVHLKNLEDTVHVESMKTKNATIVQQIDQILTNITDEIDIIAKNGKLFQAKHDDDIGTLENVRKFLSLYESERWAFLVILLSITMCVLFTGVVAFCKQSKKGAVVFSAIGFFIFVVVWLLISVSLPVTIALADFCRDGDQVTRKNLGNLYETVQFYNTCVPVTTHDNLPLPIASHVALLNNIPASKSQLDRLMEVAFNSSAAITNSSSAVGDDITKLLKLAGAVSSSSSCYVFHDDVVNFYYGTCNQSVAGMSIYLMSILLLGLLLFTLLIVVSKTWNLFSRLPHEYVEVDEDDPFFPRGQNDSTIPVDIYGTHVYNPRTRDRTEPSTNTTSGTADEPIAPLWSQNVSAPLVTNSMTRQPFMSDHPYNNYEDRYN